MNIYKMMNEFARKIPVMWLIKMAFLVVLVTKIFSFNVELGSWGKVALNSVTNQYKTVMFKFNH